MFDLINDVDALNIELDCAIDNLLTIHDAMAADEGRNWERLINAVYSVCLQFKSVQKQLDKRVNNAVDALRTQRG